MAGRQHPSGRRRFTLARAAAARITGRQPPRGWRRITLASAAVARIAGRQPPRGWRRLTPFPVARRTTHAIPHSAGVSTTPSQQRVRQAAVTACGAACSRCRRARRTPPPQRMRNLAASRPPTHGKGTQAAATSTWRPQNRMNEHKREHQNDLRAVRHPVPSQCPLNTNAMKKWSRTRRLHLSLRTRPAKGGPVPPTTLQDKTNTIRAHASGCRPSTATKTNNMQLGKGRPTASLGTRPADPPPPLSPSHLTHQGDAHVPWITRRSATRWPPQPARQGPWLSPWY